MSDFGAFLQAVIALVFVLCLIGLSAIALRRYAPLLAKSMQLRNGRLKLLEVLPLDPRHRAILLRCDEREHLLVVGEGGVTVVASGAAVAAPTETAP